MMIHNLLPEKQFNKSSAMVKNFICLAGLLTSIANAVTIISVLEFGKRGSARRTTSNKHRTSVAGVQSLWKAMANEGPQHAGMTVVPDLFQRSKDSIVVGISGVNLDNMPTLSHLVENEGNENLVGRMSVPGTESKVLCSKTRNSKKATAETLVEAVNSQLTYNNFSSVHIETNPEMSSQTDRKVEALMSVFKRHASDSTLIVYLVVEEEDSVAHRRLGDADVDEEDRIEGDQEYEKFQVGYYDSNGVWVRPYKDIFEIQYFNVVLGTCLGLFLLVFYAVYLMVDMPLMPDTLLFGESVKVQ